VSAPSARSTRRRTKSIMRVDCNLAVGLRMVQCFPPGGLVAYSWNEGTAKPLREYHDSPPIVRRLPAGMSRVAYGWGWSVGRTAGTEPACRSIQSAERTAAEAPSELAFGATIHISREPVRPRAYSRRMARQSNCCSSFVMPRPGKRNLAGNARYYIGNAPQTARLATLRMSPMIQINIVVACCS
jgi:hypothetical protein